jgi:hypothetical protein
LFKIIKKIIFSAGLGWKYNTRYWTNGLRSSNTSFKWCSNGQPLGNSLWSAGQPNNANNSENCAQMVIYKKESVVLLEDRKCNVISAVACQARMILNTSKIESFKTSEFNE